MAIDYNIHNEEFATKQDIEQIKSKIQELKSQIDLIKELKTDRTELQLAVKDCNNETTILAQRISEIRSDRKEDREAIQELKSEIKELKDAVNSFNLTNMEIKTNQKNTDVKIQELNVKMTDLQVNLTTIQKTLDNSAWNTLKREMNEHIWVKYLMYFIIIIIGLTVLSSFSFYMSHGLPWESIKDTFNLLK